MAEFKILKAKATESDGIENFQDKELPWGGYSLAGLEDELRIKLMSVAELIAWIVDEKDDFQAFLEASRKMKYCLVLFKWDWQTIATRQYKHLLDPGSVVGNIVRINYAEKLPVLPCHNLDVADILKGYFEQREAFPIPTAAKPPTPLMVDCDSLKGTRKMFSLTGCESVRVRLLEELDFSIFKRDKLSLAEGLDREFGDSKFKGIVFLADSSTEGIKRQAVAKGYCATKGVHLRYVYKTTDQFTATLKLLKVLYDKLIAEIPWFA